MLEESISTEIARPTFVSQFPATVILMGLRRRRDPELGVAPLEETQLLYQQIIALSPPSARAAVGQPGSQDIAQLVHELHLVRQSLVEAARALESINKAVSSLTSIDEAASVYSDHQRR